MINQFQLNPSAPPFRPDKLRMIDLTDHSLPKMHMLNPNAPPFIYNSEDFLNITAKIFVPNLDPNTLNCVRVQTPDYLEIENDFNTTPEVFDSFTPNVSFGDAPAFSPFEEIFRSLCGESFYFDGLFLLIFIILSLFMFSFMFLRVEAGSSDQDLNGLISPHDILHSLRLKSGDRIIIGHININSIRHKIGLLGDMTKDKIQKY